MASMLGLIFGLMIKGLAYLVLVGGGLLAGTIALAAGLALVALALALGLAAGALGLGLGVLVAALLVGVAVLPLAAPLLLLFFLLRPRHQADAAH